VFSAQPQGAVAEFLRAPNLSVEAILDLETSMIGPLAPLGQLLRRTAARILHLHFVNFISGFPWLARTRGVDQVFFTAHSSNPPGFQVQRAPAWKRTLVRAINAPLTKVFCVSDYTRRSLADLDVLPADRFALIYDAIMVPDLACAAQRRAEFRARYGIPMDCDLVTQVSWIIPEKGIPELLEAAQIILRQRPRTHFAMVGSGAFETEYQRRAEALGIAHAITWTGLMKNPMEEGVYAATDIFCLASQWQEAFGFVLAEAMSFEKPAVATAVGGIPEVVQDGVSGLLCPVGDSQALAGQLLRLLEDPPLRRQMGQAGRLAVEAKFNLRKNVAELLTYYRL
jgi:glycosyltransferase involved in cell wall biosynthesis